jgi:hypothetical protein
VDSEEYAEYRVCPSCGFHYTIGARRRIALLTDPKSFRETNRSYIALDPLHFSKEYRRRLVEEQGAGCRAIVTRHGADRGNRVVLAVIDFRFLGTIGSVVREAGAAFGWRRAGRPIVSSSAAVRAEALALAQIVVVAAQRRLTAAHALGRAAAAHHGDRLRVSPVSRTTCWRAWCDRRLRSRRGRSPAAAGGG